MKKILLSSMISFLFLFSFHSSYGAVLTDAGVGERIDKVQANSPTGTPLAPTGMDQKGYVGEIIANIFSLNNKIKGNFIEAFQTIFNTQINTIPRWNGQSFIAGTIRDDGTSIGIGTGVLNNRRVNIFGDINFSGDLYRNGTLYTPTLPTDIVRTTGDQTIAGIKTFTNPITLSGATSPVLNFINTNTNAYGYITANSTLGSIAIVADANDTVAGSRISFSVDTNAATPKMVITGSGNIGIGTSSPTQLLDVNGKIRMRTQTASGDTLDTVATKGYVDSKIGSGTGTGGGNSFTRCTNSESNDINNEACYQAARPNLYSRYQALNCLYTSSNYVTTGDYVTYSNGAWIWMFHNGNWYNCKDGSTLVVDLQSGTGSGSGGSGGGWVSSNQQVFNGQIIGNNWAGTTGWVDLNLSSIVGNKETLVYLRVSNTSASAGVGDALTFRPKGVSTRPAGATASNGQGAGASTLQLYGTINREGYLLATTNSSGIVEMASYATQNWTIHLVGYVGGGNGGSGGSGGFKDFNNPTYGGNLLCATVSSSATLNSLTSTTAHQFCRVQGYDTGIPTNTIDTIGSYSWYVNSAWAVGGNCGAYIQQVRCLNAGGSASGSGSADNLGNHTATQNLNLGNNKVTNLATPTVSSDAATKGYVDSRLSPPICSGTNKALGWTGTAWTCNDITGTGGNCTTQTSSYSTCQYSPPAGLCPAGWSPTSGIITGGSCSTNNTNFSQYCARTTCS